jgi:plasmid stabilization system protein ParE
MAYKIIWSENALQDRLQILDYWFHRLGNKKYSAYLDSQFQDAIKILADLPEAGRVHPQTNTRFIVKEYYLIFYKFNGNEIHVLHLFDGRRNPKNLSDWFIK